MKIYRSIVASVIGTAAALSFTSPVAALAEDTKTNLMDSMRREAFAFAAYQAFAEHSEATGYSWIASLFRSTADKERDDHFAKGAALASLVGDSAANLNEAIPDEEYEATLMYPDFANQAATDGDEVAAALFRELASDEAQHEAAEKQALQALQGTGTYPGFPPITIVPIIPGPAKSQGATLENLRAAMRGEAFAAAKYREFGFMACKEGNWELGKLFEQLSNIERREHLAALANLAGLVGSTAQNLATAVADSADRADTAYPGYADAAYQAGDNAVGDYFTALAGDEANNRDAFQRVLDMFQRPL